MVRVPVITVDGPSGSGKGTLAQRIAEALGWHFLDSGAIYRVLGLMVERAGIGGENVDKITDMAKSMPLSFDQGRVLLDGEDVSRIIRTETIGNAASKVAALPQVREALLAWQRNYARSPGLVADGRDMGTVVFPQAKVKIFLTASAEERAQRRYKQLKEKGLGVNLARLTEEIRERDERDSKRAVAPLVASESAYQLDSTAMTIDEVYGQAMQIISTALSDIQS
ncbi:MAG: (d)CMP kinase [Candidatus Thiodiazotropha endolucinida]|uniref:Cytidylate kinase n=1 Tax=Candidatus Thiodiazotropha taylori TaxID=2792791 RepID=A0A9E4NK33_9GAMM|nr:(d)CMP kinase [Candidatus Thiodiazotropha taylori]MBT3038511.1 (d)CMP kinase [Candidatus Thiodiazotropha sp. (ex Codakia orbicularis)]MCW4236345.1 (d)CMP kinase [Candidatus Thiodiazotropha endolucinida]MBT3044117.1 (d)CMP kinase [Candidatus Thiodiazotropha sp. (ex Codakia orbicularis)]MBV2126597.1 (d)CMP kinase [Candidatus Thiodiazotropha taylori]